MSQRVNGGAHWSPRTRSIARESIFLRAYMVTYTHPFSLLLSAYLLSRFVPTIDVVFSLFVFFILTCALVRWRNSYVSIVFFLATLFSLSFLSYLQVHILLEYMVSKQGYAQFKLHNLYLSSLGSSFSSFILSFYISFYTYVYSTMHVFEVNNSNMNHLCQFIVFVSKCGRFSCFSSTKES